MKYLIGLIIFLGSLAAAQDQLRVDSLTIRNGRAELVVSLPRFLTYDPAFVWNNMEGEGCEGPRLSTDPLYVGWAFAKPRDFGWTDLPHVKVLPKDFDKPVTLRAPLGVGYTRSMVAVWAGTHGKLLCKLMTSIPTYAFYGSNAEFVPFVDVPVRVRVLDAGGGAIAVNKSIAAVKSLFAEKKIVVKITNGGRAQKNRDKTEILVRDAAHVGFGESLQQALHSEPIKPWPESPDTITIAVGR